MINSPKKRKTLDQKNFRELVKEADKWFSRYVRLRDCELIEGEWLGQCITCDRRLTVVDREGHWNAGSNLGHFVGRSAMSTRFSEENCNLQCAHCNAWLDKETMITAYRKALKLKYGDNVPGRLVREGKQLVKLTKADLLEIIHDSKVQIDYYLNK